MIWEEDLKIWKQAELEFMAKLASSEKVVNISWPQWKFRDYDILATLRDWKDVTYEVKTDGIYPTSKCVGIEYECKGNPSWILTSKADYYVYKLGSDFYFVEKWKLLELLMLSETKKMCQGWDDGTAKLWVIPEEEFYTVARKM